MGLRGLQKISAWGPGSIPKFVCCGADTQLSGYLKVGVDSVGLTTTATTERRRWTRAVAVSLGRVDCINRVWTGPIPWRGGGGMVGQGDQATNSFCGPYCITHACHCSLPVFFYFFNFNFVLKLLLICSIHLFGSVEGHFTHETRAV